MFSEMFQPLPFHFGFSSTFFAFFSEIFHDNLDQKRGEKCTPSSLFLSLPRLTPSHMHQRTGTGTKFGNARSQRLFRTDSSRFRFNVRPKTTTLNTRQPSPRLGTKNGTRENPKRVPFPPLLGIFFHGTRKKASGTIPRRQQSKMSPGKQTGSHIPLLFYISKELWNVSVLYCT